MHFHFGLILPSACSLFMCECGHGLDASDVHLVHCTFGGQRIATHDAIWDVMYALIRENGHTIWRERWYVFKLGVSLKFNLYMIRKDQVFVVDGVITNMTREIVASSVISQLAGAAENLTSLLKSTNIKGLHEGHHFILMTTEVHLGLIWIVSSRSVPVFSMINDQEVIYFCFFAFKFLDNMLVLFFNML